MPHVGNWVKVQREEAAIRERCRALYLENRAKLAEIILREAASDLGDTDIKNLSEKVVKWMTAWEVPERQAKRRAIANTSPERRLAELVEQVERFKSNLDLSEEAFAVQGSEMNARNVAHWFRLWTEAKRQLLDVESEMTVAENQERVLDPYWKSMQTRIYKRVLRDYHGKGEIYRSLCDRFSSLQVALMRLEEQGRMDSDTYTKLQAEFTASANQLQRYTEAQKVDVTETHVAEIGGRLMQIIERRLFNQPQLLDLIYGDLEGHMDDVVEGRNIKLLPVAESA